MFPYALTSAYFQTTLARIPLHANTTHRIPELWRRVRHPRVHVVPKFFDKARYRGTAPTALGRKESLAIVGGVLRRPRFRVLVDGKDPEHALYADRNA